MRAEASILARRLKAAGVAIQSVIEADRNRSGRIDITSNICIQVGGDYAYVKLNGTPLWFRHQQRLHILEIPATMAALLVDIQYAFSLAGIKQPTIPPKKKKNGDLIATWSDGRRTTQFIRDRKGNFRIKFIGWKSTPGSRRTRTQGPFCVTEETAINDWYQFAARGGIDGWLRVM